MNGREFISKYKGIIIACIIIIVSYIILCSIPKEQHITMEDLDFYLQNTDFGNSVQFIFGWEDTIGIPQDNNTYDIDLNISADGIFTKTDDIAYTCAAAYSEIKTPDTIDDTSSLDKMESYLVKKDDKSVSYEYDFDNDVWFYIETPEPENITDEEINYDSLKELIVQNTVVRVKEEDMLDAKVNRATCTFNMSDPHITAFLNDNTKLLENGDNYTLELIKTLATFGSDITCTATFFIADFGIYTNDIELDFSQSNTPYLISELFFPYDIDMVGLNATQDTKKFTLTVKCFNKDIVLPEKLEQNAISFEDYMAKYYGINDSTITIDNTTETNIETEPTAQTKQTEENTQDFDTENVLNDLFDSENDENMLDDEQKNELNDVFSDFLDNIEQ